jgi:hypothetical protein
MAATRSCLQISPTLPHYLRTTSTPYRDGLERAEFIMKFQVSATLLFLMMSTHALLTPEAQQDETKTSYEGTPAKQTKLSGRAWEDNVIASGREVQSHLVSMFMAEASISTPPNTPWSIHPPIPTCSFNESSNTIAAVLTGNAPSLNVMAQTDSASSATSAFSLTGTNLEMLTLSLLSLSIPRAPTWSFSFQTGFREKRPRVNPLGSTIGVLTPLDTTAPIALRSTLEPSLESQPESPPSTLPRSSTEFLLQQPLISIPSPISDHAQSSTAVLLTETALSTRVHTNTVDIPPLSEPGPSVTLLSATISFSNSTTTSLTTKSLTTNGGGGSGFTVRPGVCKSSTSTAILTCNMKILWPLTLLNALYVIGEWAS